MTTEENDLELEKIRDKNQLRALLQATQRSKGYYDDDISSLRSNMSSIDASSPIVSAATQKIQGFVSDPVYDSDYEQVMNTIRWIVY